MRFEREIYNKLQSDIRIPKGVQQQVDSALEQIAGAQQGRQRTEKKIRSFSKAFRVAAACLAVGIIGIGSSVGAYSVWNNFADQRFGVIQENKEELQEEGLINDPALKVTENGVTVECVRTVAAGKYAHLLFKVTVPEDFDLRDLKDNPPFLNYEISRNGVPVINQATIWLPSSKDSETGVWKPMIDYEQGVFYLEASADAAGEERLAGKPLDVNQDINWDGQMLNITLKNLGYSVAKETVGLTGTRRYENVVLIPGTWNLEIPMKASKEVRTCELDLTLKNGLTLHKFTITPLSLYVDYTGEGAGCHRKDPLRMAEYELKDGTILSFDVGGGSVGGRTNDGKRYSDYILDTIVNPEDIVAVYLRGERIELP